MKGIKKKHAPAGPAPEESPLVPPEEVVARVWELADPLCAAEGVELIHVEYQREPGGWVLRLFIEKPHGVDVEDCSTVSRQLGDLLDMKLDIEFPYTLEVSSPGPERPLSRREDFNRFAGCRIRIRTRRQLGGQKNFKGILAGIDEDIIRLTLEKETIAIPYREISKARLVNYHGDDKC